jgi:hypothetical protein
VVNSGVGYSQPDAIKEVTVGLVISQPDAVM